MAGLTTALDNKVIDHVNAVAALTAPTAPLKCRLMTANGTATAAGTEVAGGTYTPQSVAFPAASAGATANSGTLSFTGMPSCTVVGLEVWDSAGSPVRLWWGPLAASKIINPGDTFTVNAGDLTLGLT